MGKISPAMSIDMDTSYSTLNSTLEVGWEHTEETQKDSLLLVWVEHGPLRPQGFNNQASKPLVFP